MVDALVAPSETVPPQQVDAGEDAGSPIVINSSNDDVTGNDDVAGAIMQNDALAVQLLMLSADDRWSLQLPDTLVCAFVRGFKITMLDLATLRPGGNMWLTDAIMNAFGSFVRWRPRSNADRIYFATSHLITKQLREAPGSRRSLRWTRKLDLFDDFDKVMIPIHLAPVHWILVTICLRDKTIKVFDSLAGVIDCQEHIAAVQEWLRLNWCFGKNSITRCTTATPIWGQTSADCPQQDNSYDCGVFTLMAMNDLSLGLDLSYSAVDAPAFRRRIYEGIWLNRAPATGASSM